MGRPEEALVAIPLETRRFEDLGALAAIADETRYFEDLGGYLFEPMIERVRVAQQHAGELLGGRTVWMVNSTALGGGVAQLLRTLLPYWRGAGIDVRWMVLRGSAEFFRVTKRFHNHLQGQPDDGGVLGIDELTILDRAAHYYARALASQLAPGDVVVLNDPQTAAMSVPLERAGANVIWSCHVGIDQDNELSRHAWSCLRPRLAGVHCFVFSRYTSLPETLGGVETSILTPAIDPASTKNRPMSDGAARAILQHLGLAAGAATAIPSYDCTDGSTATLAARPTVLDSDAAPDWNRIPVVVSLARWDRIKDPLGILDGFLERVLAATDAHLLQGRIGLRERLAATAPPADAGFPVEVVEIVGYDMRLVERVTGRLTKARAAGMGAAAGAWWGLFVGLLAGLFTTGPEWLGLILGGLLIGAFFGAVFGFFAHWGTRGQRDFSSVSNLVAGRYELTVPDDQAHHARELLGQLR